MPRLLLPAYEGSMGYEALRFCLHCQKRRPPRGVPWGVSESGFYAFDSNLNYQYKSPRRAPPGAPRRGHGRRSPGHIAPYATFLTLTTDPQGALRNLAAAGAAGHDGTLRLISSGGFHPGPRRPGWFPWCAAHGTPRGDEPHLMCATPWTTSSCLLRDPSMARAEELLTERAPANGAVFGGGPRNAPCPSCPAGPIPPPRKFP